MIIEFHFKFVEVNIQKKLKTEQSLVKKQVFVAQFVRPVMSVENMLMMKQMQEEWVLYSWQL